MRVAQVVKDITAVASEGAPRKRIRTHLRESELRKLAADNSSKLDRLLAIAAYKAEEHRSEAEQRPLDQEKALACLEQNPFRWEAPGKQSRVEVGFLWTWRDSHGDDRQSFVFLRLDNVFSQGIPRPPGLDEADKCIYELLLKVATLAPKAESFCVTVVRGDAAVAKWTTNDELLTPAMVHQQLPDEYEIGAYKIKLGDEDRSRPDVLS